MRSIILLAAFIICIGCSEKEVKPSNLPLPEKEVVMDGFNRPWSIAFLSENDALVTEKNGDLVRVDLTSKTRRVVKGFPKDLTDSIGVVHFGDNSGIFEVITHPNYYSNQLIYLSS